MLRGYELQAVDWEPAAVTWRDYLQVTGRALEDLLDQMGVDVLALDDPMDEGYEA